MTGPTERMAAGDAAVVHEAVPLAASASDSAEVSAESRTPVGLRRRAWRWFRRRWPVIRFVGGIALAGAVLWVLGSHRNELQGIGAVFDHLRWWWMLPALLVELASLAAFAVMDRRLLGAGGLRSPFGPLLGVTVASQAMMNSIPAGPAVASVYGFRWFRRFGADDGLAGWALVGSAVAAALSLALVAAGGAALAAEEGASLGLIGVIVGVLLVTVAVGALFVYERPLAAIVTGGVRLSRRLTGRPHGDVAVEIDRVVARIMVVRLGWRGIAVVVGWGLANWLLDCACFAMSFLAIGAGIPWKGLLLAYGAGQLAANLPVTPGGLGAVEGSITIALVAFGGSQATTVDAVFIYRLISFWLVMVLGWGAWAVLALGVRRGRWARQALHSRITTGARAPSAGLGRDGAAGAGQAAP